MKEILQMTLGSETALVVVERSADVVVQASFTEDYPNDVDDLEDYLTVASNTDVSIVVQYGGNDLTATSKPSGYLDIVTGGGAISPCAEYVFSASSLPPGPATLVVNISYKGDSGVATVSV